MWKRILVPFFCFLFLSSLLSGCGGKYSDAVEANEAFIEMMEAYVESLEKADGAEDVAKAMNRYADAMEDLLPRMKHIAEKYPELNDQNNPPEELKESQKKSEEVGRKMIITMVKAKPYLSDPEVQKALKRFGAFGTKQ